MSSTPHFHQEKVDPGTNQHTSRGTARTACCRPRTRTQYRTLCKWNQCHRTQACSCAQTCRCRLRRGLCTRRGRPGRRMARTRTRLPPTTGRHGRVHTWQSFHLGSRGNCAQRRMPAPCQMRCSPMAPGWGTRGRYPARPPSTNHCYKQYSSRFVHHTPSCSCAHPRTCPLSQNRCSCRPQSRSWGIHCRCLCRPQSTSRLRMARRSECCSHVPERTSGCCCNSRHSRQRRAYTETARRPGVLGTSHMERCRRWRSGRGGKFCNSRPHRCSRRCSSSRQGTSSDRCPSSLGPISAQGPQCTCHCHSGRGTAGSPRYPDHLRLSRSRFRTARSLRHRTPLCIFAR
mmetsp:Transcript_39618/g.93807  ORF Transcript_39618/g.93807 Transcript_39618/m.93807 type:complete len:344 (+) Transcript_39618:81-1112(+)